MRNKNNIKITLIVMFYCISWGILSQNKSSINITGTITTTENETLPGAAIIIENTGFGTASDFQGLYKLKNLPTGNYIISVSFVGYITVSKTVKLNDSSKTINIDFVLTKNSENLSEVFVLGKSKGILVKEKGFTAEVIEIKEIQSQSIELNNLLNQTAGISVRQNGGLGSRVNYTINGLSGKAVRFFIDGVPLDYFGASYSINNIPISLIDKIEVYKGVIPVELGNDALGGAINLITKKEYNNAEVSYSYGSFNTNRISGYGNIRDQKSGLTAKLAAFYNYSDNNYKIWGDDIYVTDPETFEIERGITAERFHDAFKSKVVKANIGFTEKKWTDQIFVGFLYSNMDKEIQHGPTMEVPFGEATYNQEVAIPHLSYHKNDFLTKNLDANLFSSYSKLVRSRVDTTKNIYNWYGDIEGLRSLGGEQVQTLNTLTQKVFLNRLNLVYKINEKHKLGYNYIFSDLNRKDNDPIVTQKSDGYWAPQTLQKHSMGLSLQSKLVKQKLNSSLFVKWHGFNAKIKTSETVGGVTTYNTELASEDGLGYGLAASYKVLRDLLLNISVEKAYRLPESEEILGDGLNITSTTLLRPESSFNINVGFNLKILQNTQHLLTLGSNLFYRDVSDLIQLYQYDSSVFVYTNFDEVLMKGIDGKVQYGFKDFFTFTQSVSYLNPIIKSDKDEYGNDNITYNTTLPNTPLFQTNSEARFHFKDLIQNKSKAFVYANLNYVDEYYRYSDIIGEFNKDKIPSQMIVNCGVGYTFPKENLSLSLDATNLFNEQVFDNYAIQKPGSAFYVKATYSIF